MVPLQISRRFVSASLGVCMPARGATRSCRTRVPDGFTRTSPTRHRVRFPPKTRRVFRAGYPVPGYPISNVSPWSAYLTITSRNPSNTQQTIPRKTRTIPTRYYACSYTAIHGHEFLGPGTRGYPFSNVSPWSACLTIPPDTLQNTKQTIQSNEHNA